MVLYWNKSCFQGRVDSVEWNGGQEWWNGLEWNGN